MDELETLKIARADYQAHGFATNEWGDEDDRCALGSVIFALSDGENCVPSWLGHGTPLYKIFLAVEGRLNRIAFKRYNQGIIKTNDDPNLGRPAVLDCFDIAIKECEEEA